MILSSSIIESFSKWSISPDHPFSLEGLGPTEWPFFHQSLIQTLGQGPSSLNSQIQLGPKHTTHYCVTPTQEMAEEIYSQLKNSTPYQIMLYPGLEISPYQGAFASEIDLFKRMGLFYQLVKAPGHHIVVCSIEAFLLKMPPVDFFEKHSLVLKVGEQFPPEKLKLALQELGHVANYSADEPGTFAQKGEIFDIYPINRSPFRLTFFDEEIESIFAMDPTTQKSLKHQPIELVSIAPSPNIISVQKELLSNLRQNLPLPPTTQKKKFQWRSSVLERLKEGVLFENYQIFLPLCFNQSSSLKELAYSQKESFIVFLEHQKMKAGIETYFEELQNDLAELEQNDGDFIPPHYHRIYEQQLDYPVKVPYLLLDKVPPYHSTDHSSSSEEGLTKNRYQYQLRSFEEFFHSLLYLKTNKFEFIKAVFQFLLKNFSTFKKVIFCHTSEESKKEIIFLLESNHFTSAQINSLLFIPMNLKKSFFIKNDNVLIVSEADLFSRKVGRTKESKMQGDLFAKQLASLELGDYVIHKSLGIGKYDGLKQINLGTNVAEFFCIKYANDDLVYLPIFKLNLIQKYANKDQHLTLANLNNNQFQKQKSKAKESIKKLAFDFIELQAQRQASRAYAFSEPDHNFKEFELSFPYVETIDQRKAIDDVLNDLQNSKPMDRLVCGDVGFGKTEIAMRAAYFAVLEKKQVSILVPTTILALQHNYTFKQRFKEFPVKIEILTRFTKPKDVKRIEEEMLEGKIDILIGTQKLLNKKIEYYDLGLVIIDEEQKFGVSHKEKIKQIKSSVHILTLTATPIPRTLQQSFMGIRDFSILQTPPPKRKSIKSYLIKKEPKVIQSAIEKEIQRGGQIFYVHNKVQDLEKESAYIKKLFPGLRIGMAHGQLSETQISTTMDKFYHKEFDVLVCTTIIESGIDIPNVNTLFVNNADNFGLSQLHQIRGRIGRSEKKAYAYFILPQKQSMTENSLKRLEALITYSDLGSGFAIASSDLEIRGPGNIIGGEQSGHLEALGLELYTQLIEECINVLNGHKLLSSQYDFELQLNEKLEIPAEFIKSSSERLYYYKKLSNCNTTQDLEQIAEELKDKYGLFPKEVETFLDVIKLKLKLETKGIYSFKVSQNKIIFKFDQLMLQNGPALSEKLIAFVSKNPANYKLKPDGTLYYTQKNTIDFTQSIKVAQNLSVQLTY